MGSIRLGVGTEWLLDGRSFRIVRRQGPDQFIVLDVRFNLEQVRSTAEILAEFAEGRLRFAAGDPRSAAAPAKVLTADEDALARQRWQMIEPLVAKSKVPAREDFERRAQELRSQGQSISSRSLRRYWLAYSRSGDDRRSLAKRTLRCGARGRTRRNGLLVRQPMLRQIVDEAIASVYLTTDRRPISAVVRRTLEDLQRHNARLAANRALPVPRPGSLARTIARRIAQFDPYEIDKARWGNRIANQRHQSATRQQLATRVLERVEVDHSRLKIVVGSEAGPLGQPWLTVLIDYYSRMIVGFCIGFETPSYAVLMEALRHAILPKTYLSQRFPRVAGQWPCFGIPEKLVCDRGADLTSKDLELAAFQLGIELDFMPPRTPHLKGTVESFFDNLNDQLLSGLPGRTFRSWERRADHNPDDGPLISYDALLEIIHLHLVDVCAQSRHPMAPNTRLEMWQASAAEFPPALSGSVEDLVPLLAKTAERSLSVRGIELSGMFYSSDALMGLRSTMAAHNLAMDKLALRYNPWNLGTIWVLDPVERHFIEVPAVDVAMRGLTEYQWRVMRRAVRERFDQPDHVLSLAAARNRIRDTVEQSIKKPSRKRRARAARYSGLFQSTGRLESPPTPAHESPVPNTVSASESAELTRNSRAPANAGSPINVDDWDVDY